MSLWVNWSDDFTSVSHSVQVEKYILTIADRVTFTHAFTRDLETEGHVMFYVTFVISACICPTAMIVLLVRILGREIHSNYRRLRGLHAWPWNWMSRHGLRDIYHFCLYLGYRNDFFLFRKVFGSGNSF